MNKIKLIVFITITLVPLLFSKVTYGAPYRPPTEPPIPPPEEQNKKYPIFVASPTPCITNWCFIKHTECCFDALCVFHGETEKGGNSRCPLSAQNLEKYNPVSRIIQSVPSFLGSLIHNFISLFRK